MLEAEFSLRQVVWFRFQILIHYVLLPLIQLLHYSLGRDVSFLCIFCHLWKFAYSTSLHLIYVEVIPYLGCLVKCKKNLKINLSKFREAKLKIVHSIFLYQALWQNKNEKIVLEIRKQTMFCDLHNLSLYQPWEYNSLFIASQRLQVASSIATPSD